MTMFESARLKLTAWYLMIIMIISGLFSIAFYHSSTRELQRIITRIELQEKLDAADAPFRVLITGPRIPLTLDELYLLKQRSINTLIYINLLILVLAGAAGYFLAGRTLQPIKAMVEEQNDFISNASHELRTPLATLRAEMEGSLLEKNISDRTARHLIKSNLEEITTLQTLSNQLLRISQIHTHHSDDQIQPLSLTKVMNAAIKKVAPLAKQKKITIQSEVQDITFIGHREKLTEVFTILLDNAIKYSSQGTEISLHSQKHKEMIIINITDQGIGIDKKDLAHIFERFYRADKSRSQADGFGLGLSIAKKIVETHGGTLTVRSQLDKGSTFRIQLPLES